MEERMNRGVSDSDGKSVAYFGFRRVREQEKAQFVSRHFHFVARRYDFMNTLLSFGIHYLWKRVAVGMMGLKEGELVLDVCGGTGDLSFMAGRVVGAGGRVFLYDMNRSMMEMARCKLKRRQGQPDITCILGDAEEICFADGAFDAAMVGFGIRNLTHMERGFAEMYRILKPNGKLMCLEFSEPTAPLFRWLYDLYSFHVMPLLGEIIAGSREAYTYLPESIRLFPLPDDLSAILEKIGFRQLRYKRLTNGIAVVHVGVKP
jgi:demethylmenaquinone methyltransferase/2-methoxy-6-polyprenyl-1,4-benzoquinol methylase